METKETPTPEKKAKNTAPAAAKVAPEQTPAPEPQAAPAEPEPAPIAPAAPVTLPEPPPARGAVNSELSIYATEANFAHGQRVAKALVSSNIVPEAYRNNLPNALVALEMANRMQLSPLTVMQNLDIIHGRPSWKSSFIIASINASGKFSPLRFKTTGTGDARACYAYAKDRETGEIVEGPPVSIGMAKSEGWFNRKGSKWQTMPELMLTYRAATLFGRLYAPEILNGLQTAEETQDVAYAVVNEPGKLDRLNNLVKPKQEREPEAVEVEYLSEEKNENEKLF